MKLREREGQRVDLGRSLKGHCRSARVTSSSVFAFLSSSKLKENITELHIIVRTTGYYSLKHSSRELPAQRKCS